MTPTSTSNLNPNVKGEEERITSLEYSEARAVRNGPVFVY